MTRRGHAKILDFGLAMAARQRRVLADATGLGAAPTTAAIPDEHLTSPGTAVYRADPDGGNLRAIGPGFLDSCAPDGSWYTFTDVSGRLMRAPVAGGAPRQLAGADSIPIGDISADGKQVLYLYQETVAGTIGLSTGIVSSDGGPRLASFRMPIGVWEVQWSAGGTAFQYAITRDGAGNIWEQPVAGGPPRQLTHLPGGEDIRGFTWSPDGKQLAVVRGHVKGNVVVISDFR